MPVYPPRPHIANTAKRDAQYVIRSHLKTWLKLHARPSAILSLIESIHAAEALGAHMSPELYFDLEMLKQLWMNLVGKTIPTTADIRQAREGE